MPRRRGAAGKTATEAPGREVAMMTKIAIREAVDVVRVVGSAIRAAPFRGCATWLAEPLVTGV
jgi:hypothetical protein